MASRSQNWLPLILALGAFYAFSADANGQRPHDRGQSGGSSSRPAPSGGGGGGGAPSRPAPAPAPRESAPSRPAPVQSAPSRPSPSQSAPSRPSPAPESRAPSNSGRSTYSAPTPVRTSPEAPSRNYTPPVREPARSSGVDSTNRGDSSRTRDDSGRQAPAAPSRVYDSARRTADDRETRTPAGTGNREGRGEIDLSGFSAGRRAGVPALSTSTEGGRGAGIRPEPTRSGAPIRSAPLTREGLLERYRAPAANPADLARARERAQNGLSRARGAAGEVAASSGSERRGRKDPAVSNELRKQQYERSAARLARLEKKDPAQARKVLRTGESIAIASDIGLRVAIGTTFANCGGGSGWTWWDPCNHGYGSPANVWWNNCGPCSYWWWNNCTYWWPTWGWGYSWGAGWSTWSWGWMSHPSYCYPGYRYWGCSPWWYSSVIYVDTYDPPPQQQVVVVHEYENPPAAEAQPAAEVQRGEAAVGGNLPPEKRDPALVQALARSAQQYVALGDLAFSERRFGDAVSHYAKAIEYAPDDAVLYMLLSDALFATGDYHYAASALRKALEIEPRLVDTIVDKHAVYNDPQDFEKQLGYLESYLKDNFLDEDARLVLAANYLFGNKPHQALDLLQSSFSLEVRKSPAGTALFERAQRLVADNPFSK